MASELTIQNTDIDFLSNSGSDDGIGILVDMAKQGKIDPWNIDIVDVTDKYLAHMCELKEQNLRVTGRTFLFASVLLRLKSNILDGISLSAFESSPQEDPYDVVYTEEGFIAEYGQEDYLPTNNVVSIDDVLQRRTSVKLNHNRVVTLKDLIRQLKFYETLEKKQSLKQAHERAKNRVRSYSRLTADDIVNLAHDEFIDKNVLVLKENLEQIFEKQEKIELNELTLLGMDKIEAYLALLFLTVESDYDIYQKEFYSDLYVVRRQADLNKVDDDVNSMIDNAIAQGRMNTNARFE
jgi:segregation and condensation protein A